MLWFGRLLLLGMLAFSAKSEVVPDGVQLGCNASLLPDSAVLFRATPPLASQQSDSSWHMTDETKIAHFPDYNATLVKELTNSSITMFQCMDLRFYRSEWNETSKLRMSWAVCEVNCSALMMQLRPGLTLATDTNSTNSTQPPPPMGSPRLDTTTVALCAVGGVLLAALLIGLGVNYFQKWYANKKNRNRSTTKYISTNEKVNFQPVQHDDDMC